jgi:hypothetical protein
MTDFGVILNDTPKMKPGGKPFESYQASVAFLNGISWIRGYFQGFRKFLEAVAS